MTAPTDDTQDRLARLPDRHRAVLRAALTGFGDADVAALLGIPVEAVRTTLRLAAAKLVTVLAERPIRAPDAGLDAALDAAPVAAEGAPEGPGAAPPAGTPSPDQ